MGRKMMMRKLVHYVMFLLFVLFSLSSGSCRAVSPARPFPVGLILDLETPLGKMCQASVLVALDDFYRSHAEHTARLEVHTRDSGRDVVGAASAAVDLLKNVEVQAILGPTTSDQASFLVHLGEKSRVPIISFSATSPSLSPRHTPFFVRTALNDSSQVGAIAAIVQAFGWKGVVPLYEDTEYGAGVIPYLSNAFQDTEVRFAYHSVISPSATDDQILEELYKLKKMQTRVFIVYMSSSLGSRLFMMANKAGMMAEGYVWIITDGITSLLDSLEPRVIDSMQGVLGVMPHVPGSKALDDFIDRWRARLQQQYPTYRGKAEPSISSMWAYDTTWALAVAAEQVESSAARGHPFQKDSAPLGNATDLDAIGVSQVGSRLRDVVLKTEFGGLTGEFRVVDGQLQSSAFQIVNVAGTGRRTVGFWTPSGGITRRLSSTSSSSVAGAAALAHIFWPGESTSVPRGWEIPTSGKKLRIGVPAVNGFKKFVTVRRDPLTNRTVATGYSIDVFDAVMAALPYDVPYEFVPFENGPESGHTYNDLVYQVYLQKYDAVVGDVTIIAHRSLYVDFTLPYTESGVSMVVPLRRDGGDGDAWIFVRPLTVDLWLLSLAFFFFTGFVVWVIEHRINREFRGPPSQHVGNIVYFAFSTLVFAHKDRMESNLSRFVMIIWVFVVFILTSSYTASLSSVLTVQKLRPTVVDVKQLLDNRDCVGYLASSFVEDLLKAQLKFDPSKLRPYSTPDEYAEALRRGSRNGGVAAIFDEIPYIKIFLAQEGRDFAMVGPTYKTDGFGFVFPKGSPLVQDVSRAVLNVTQGDMMAGIERKWFGDSSAYATEDTSLSSSSLSIGSFWGLFLITGAASTSALLAFFVGFLCDNWGDLKTRASAGKSLPEKITALVKQLDQKDPTSHGFRKDKPLTPSPYGDESSRRTVGGSHDAAASLQGRLSTTDIRETSSNTSGEAMPSTDLCSHSIEVAAASHSEEQTEMSDSC